MQIDYNVSGSDRKQLVAAIVQHTGEKAKYLGAPDFAFQVGEFTVSVDGRLPSKITVPLCRSSVS